MLFIIGNSKKFKGEDRVEINRRGVSYQAVIKVFRDYVTLFLIPVIPVGKSYSIYFPATGEFYEDSLFSKIPEEYREACRQAGKRY